MSDLHLEPCFCGQTPDLFSTPEGALIRCTNKRCFGPTTPLYGSPDDAAAAWNNRAPLPEAEFDARMHKIAIMLQWWGMTNSYQTAARLALEIALGTKAGPLVKQPEAAELGNELWEFLFRELDGHLPFKLTDRVLLKAGEHLLNCYSITEKVR